MPPILSFTLIKLWDPMIEEQCYWVNTVMSDDLVQGALDEIVKCECEYVSLLEKYESLLEYVD